MVVDGFFIAGAAVCLLSTLVCVGAAAIRQPPNDITILAVAAVELFLLVYLVAGVLRQAGGESVAGEPWEFWGYLVTALMIPVGAFWWAILERSRWSNLVLGAVGITIFVMLFRMEQIWDGVVPA
ncbi:hypothetical protein GC088_05670 [Arthrobacter sp. JZ12]|uniref:hypothetical protein n=1 Tax=Arthrobacter sp. JZ12 TaxID=2654190 RepID=UPI002B469802|nr:hypothetical protein [Arthrobacter sp. JZ12]WRH24609.1 hypothetical protein GC088_05670 [Arthrobacter sp. JZ12]